MEFEEIDQRIKQGLFRNLEDIAAYVPSIGGVLTGLGHLDRLTSGLRPGKLNFVAAFTSHGKTSLILKTAIHNFRNDPDFTFLMMSGDDTDDMILTKLIAFNEDMSIEAVEDTSPKWRIDYVKTEFKDRLIIATPQVNESYSVSDCAHIYNETCNELGVEPTFVAFDYLALLKTREIEGPQNIRNKAQALKGLIRRTDASVWLVGTQCRKDAEDASVLTLNHMEYGGHQDADGVVIGCRRRSPSKMTEAQLREEEQCPRVYISVMKNKINGRKSLNPVGTEYAIDKTSGIIRELTMADVSSPSRNAQVVQFKIPSRKVQSAD